MTSVERIEATLMITVAAVLAFHSLTVDRVDYHGWVGCYRLTNGDVELVYVPQVGRIMRYAFVGARNVLWENSLLAGRSVKPGQTPRWANYGGDKVWPAPQSVWNWPPDSILDGSPYEVAVDGDTLLVTGQASPKAGVMFKRRISMSSHGTGVTIIDSMTNTSAKEQELAVWENAQVNDPDEVTVPLEKTPEMPLGWAPYDDKPVPPEFADIRAGKLVAHRNPKAGFKLGSASSKGWLSARAGQTAFTMQARKQPGGYPDGGKFLQLYGNANPDKYMELEITGPLTKLRPGQTVDLEIHWRLDPSK
jgi:hypothetical protein